MHGEKNSVHNFNVAAINGCICSFILMLVAVIFFYCKHAKIDCNKCEIEKKENPLQNDTMRIKVRLGEVVHLLNIHFCVSGKRSTTRDRLFYSQRHKYTHKYAENQ